MDLFYLSWVCPCRKCIHHSKDLREGVQRQLPQQLLIWTVIRTAVSRPDWPLWFTDTDLGFPCRDRGDKWRHSTADLTAWKFNFRCWGRRREVRVISFLTVSIAKTCSVTAAWSHLTADLFLWRLYERATVGTTRTDARFRFIFYDVGAENLVFKLADSGMHGSLKLAFLVTRSGRNYMQLQLSSCSLCSTF